MAMVNQDMKAGKLKEWGAYMFENKGYAVYEGTEAEVATMLGQYNPYVSFKVQPVNSVDQVDEIMKTLLSG